MLWVLNAIAATSVDSCHEGVEWLAYFAHWEQPVALWVAVSQGQEDNRAQPELGEPEDLVGRGWIEALPTLTRQLRELERDGLVTRTQYNEIPPRVECDITDTAHTLIPILEHIAAWTTSHGQTLVGSVTQG